MALTEAAMKDYAEHVLLSHTEDIDSLSVYEMWESYSERPDGHWLSEAEEADIWERIQKARVTISWEDDEPLV